MTLTPAAASTVACFGVFLVRTWGRSYSARLAQITIYAHEGPECWDVAIHDATGVHGVLALGHGPTLEDAEACCERWLRRHAELRTEALTALRAAREGRT